MSASIFTIDEYVHEVFNMQSGFFYKPPGGQVRCPRCDNPLRTYYAEKRLYAVKCSFCQQVTLVKAGNPMEAAEAVRGRAGRGKVVRCKQCEDWEPAAGEEGGYCTNPNGLDNYAEPNDFCSYGRKKENEK